MVLAKSKIYVLKRICSASCNWIVITYLRASSYLYLHDLLTARKGKITGTSSEHYWCHHGNSLLLFNFVYVVNILIKGFSRVRKLYSHKSEYWSMELEVVSFNSYELMFLYLFRASIQIIDVCISLFVVSFCVSCYDCHFFFL